MTARYGINQFKASLADRGLATDTQFIVSIPTPSPLVNSTKGTDFKGLGGIIDFAAHAIEVPGVTYNTSETRRYGAGPTRQYPLTNAFADINASFYMDQDGMVLKFFQEWTESIFNSRPKTGEDGVRTFQTHSLSYKSQYARDIEILLYKRHDEQYAKYKLINAWPIIVGTMQMDWRGESKLLTVPVRLNYDLYEYTAVLTQQEKNIVKSGNQQQNSSQKTAFTNPARFRDKEVPVNIVDIPTS